MHRSKITWTVPEAQFCQEPKTDETVNWCKRGKRRSSGRERKVSGLFLPSSVKNLKQMRLLTGACWARGHQVGETEKSVVCFCPVPLCRSNMRVFIDVCVQRGRRLCGRWRRSNFMRNTSWLRVSSRTCSSSSDTRCLPAIRRSELGFDALRWLASLVGEVFLPLFRMFIREATLLLSVFLIYLILGGWGWGDVHRAFDSLTNFSASSSVFRTS